MNLLSKYFTYFLLASSLLFTNWNPPGKNWLSEKQKEYHLLYTASDKNNTNNYKQLVEHGITSVKTFFNSSYKNEFNIFVYPSRHSLDSTWQTDWKMPEFKSECWMVASGMATRLDILSPTLWDTAACEHRYSDTEKTQQLITHD